MFLTSASVSPCFGYSDEGRSRIRDIKVWRDDDRRVSLYQLATDH